MEVEIQERPPRPGLAVAATAPFGADVLARLAAKHEIAYLLTRPDRPRGRGRKVGPPPAKAVAERLGIPTRQPERLDESFEPEVGTVVVVAYGALIPESLLDRALWLNVHPSLLPRWRGAAPVERAIMAGDSKTGVTIHRTTAELDAGPIAARRSFPIDPEDDAGAVYAKAAPIAAGLIDEVLQEPRFSPQPDDGVTYAEKLTAADRGLDWDRPPEELLRRVRALSPHIGARTELHGRPVIIWRARIGGDRLEPVEVQPDGGTRMSYEEFLRGLRQ
jgi:methionyl-tRNA formyltransferase